MQLSITEAAMEKLTTLETDGKQNLLILYDTEGLGCAVNGLPTIRLVKDIEPSYKKVKNPSYPTYADERIEIYAGQDLTLDFVNGKFRLNNSEKILNAFISSSSVNEAIN